MKFSRSTCYSLLVGWLLVYFSGKLLFDTVPHVFELFSLGIFALCAFLLVYHNAAANLHTIGLFLTFALFAAYIIINGIFQDTFSQLARAIYEYIVYLLMFFAMMYLMPRANLPKCLKVFALWGILIACLSWYEYLTKSLLIANWEINYAFFRATVFSRSFLSHGAILGYFALVCMDICYRENKPHWFLFGLFCFASILTTASRGPLVACGIALVLQFMLNAYISCHHSWKRFAACLVFMTGIVVICVLLFGTFQTGNASIDGFLHRIRSIINWTGEAGNAGRLELWAQSIDWWKSSPWFGIGPSKTGSWGAGAIGVTESGVLKRLAELGVIGFCIYYFFVGSIFARGLCRFRKQSFAGKKQMTLWISMAIAILINDCILQCTEEIMICFYMWTAFAAMEVLPKSQAIKEVREL